MSATARQVAAAAPAPAPARRRPTTPGRATPAPRRAHEPVARPVAPPRRRRAARRFHAAFWALSALIVTTIVVALVSVSALVVETGFGLDRTEARIAQLLDERERLERDVAEMASPGRIAGWARRQGLVMPEDVVVLQVPVRGTAEPVDGEGAPA